MNKVFFFLIISCLINHFDASGQTEYFNTIQNVTPPSPDAISIVKQGFSDVNLYTGKLSYSIPIYTISQNGIQVPISLNYVGGNGIKVEEVASSVGLGWSLTSTGAVSRTIRGIPDELYSGFVGYMNLPGFDSTMLDVNHPDWDVFSRKYFEGKYDGQPDIFYLNAPGLSGQFYINKLKQIVWVEKSDIKLHMIFDGQALQGFEATATNGYVYTFDIEESSQNTCLTCGAPASRNDFDVSSWYLSKISNPFGKVIITFLYSDPNQNQISQLLRSAYLYSRNEPISDLAKSTYTHVYLKKPHLQKITFASGEVEFKASPNIRYDFGNDRSVDSIIVRNKAGATIRKVNFDYSYFDDSGIINEGEGTYYGDGDPTKRLKLDKVQFISDAGVVQSYSFTYNTSSYLPNRLSSYAMDHWGYYNGQSGNSKWVGSQRFKSYTDFGYSSFRYDDLPGDNREPDPYYAQAGILKKVSLPTGGSISFEYEGNTSTDSLLPNTISGEVLVYSTDLQPNYFNVGLLNLPFGKVRVSALAQSGFYVVFTINDSANTLAPITDTLFNSTAKTIFLGEGKYYIKAKVVGTVPPGYNLGTILHADKEVYLMNKNVGGIRIRSMKLADSLSNTHLVREYYYNEEGSANPNSPSTGQISGIPTYARQNLEWEYCVVNGFVPYGYRRELTSTYPLTMTSGSVVGYRKVTVVDSGQIKTESYFTTYADFPELNVGYATTPFTDDDKMNLGGTLVEKPPYGPRDERDFYRGKLIKEISYQKVPTGFLKVHQKDIQYQHNMGTVVNPHLVVLPDTMETVRGMLFEIGSDRFCSPINPPDPEYTFKNYKLYTGKYDIKKVTETSYSNRGSIIDSLVQETTYDYGQSPWHLDSGFHYLVSKEIKKTSVGVDTVFYYYAYDRKNNVAEILPSDTALLSAMEQKNMIGVPVIQKLKVGASHAKSSKIVYANFNSNQIYPSILQEKTGTESSFFSKAYLDKFDTLGNLLEQHLSTNITESYLYGYNNSYPVAKVTGASHSTIAALVISSVLNSISTTDAQMRTELNKIRNGLSSSNAQVTTYTYKPMVGITSITDPAGKTTYYEYDAFGRLFIVRDQNSKIIRMLCYNYAGQAENCNCSSYTANWQNTTTPLRCKKNGSNQNTGEQEQEQKDMNPCSGSYNQLRWTVVGTNLTACPLPVTCNSSNCSGANKKCINNNCETGIRVNTDSYQSGGQWVCVYHYEWSDGSWSQNYTQNSSRPCPY